MAVMNSHKKSFYQEVSEMETSKAKTVSTQGDWCWFHQLLSGRELARCASNISGYVNTFLFIPLFPPDISTKTIMDILAKVNLATVFQGDPKATFQRLQHRGVGDGTTLSLGLFHFTLDPYLIMLSIKQGGIKYHFLSIWYDSIYD